MPWDIPHDVNPAITATITNGNKLFMVVVPEVKRFAQDF
jgi:hypothetical protein